MELRDKERCRAACTPDPRLCARVLDIVFGTAYPSTRMYKGYVPTAPSKTVGSGIAHECSTDDHESSTRPSLPSKRIRDEEAQAMYAQNHDIVRIVILSPASQEPVDSHM